jgi:hypothetical protein
VACATDSTVRENEQAVWRAIKDKECQEGDKVYLYPCIVSQETITTQMKNGKIKTKVIKETGLKTVEDWKGDHDPEKLVNRVYKTAEFLQYIVNMDMFTDYGLVKNKPLLEFL